MGRKGQKTKDMKASLDLIKWRAEYCEAHNVKMSPGEIIRIVETVRKSRK